MLVAIKVAGQNTQTQNTQAQDTQAQNTQSPKIPKPKIPKAKIPKVPKYPTLIKERIDKQTAAVKEAFS